jgi:hypothetical protein
VAVLVAVNTANKLRFLLAAGGVLVPLSSEKVEPALIVAFVAGARVDGSKAANKFQVGTISGPVSAHVCPLAISIIIASSTTFGKDTIINLTLKTLLLPKHFITTKPCPLPMLPVMFLQL